VILTSLNTFLAVDHPRTIDDMFAILADWSQEEKILKHFFLIRSYENSPETSKPI
jgi:hypothetical protein